MIYSKVLLFGLKLQFPISQDSVQVSLKYDLGSAFHEEPGDEKNQKQRADKRIIMLGNNTCIIIKGLKYNIPNINIAANNCLLCNDIVE